MLPLNPGSIYVTILGLLEVNSSIKFRVVGEEGDSSVKTDVVRSVVVVRKKRKWAKSRYIVSTSWPLAMSSICHDRPLRVELL